MTAPRVHDALLLRTATGDRAAFRAFYDAVAPKLFGIALRICGDRSIAEDAVQDSFTEIWRKADQFDPARGPATGWAAVILRSRAIDHVRRRGRQQARVAEGSGGEDDGIAEIADTGARTDGGTEMMALVACLSRLDARTRQMVLLAYYRGESREELADRFDAPINSIKTWLRRGLAALRTCLDETR